ncbi:MAG: hypothetical protein CMJ25_04730 [Phycisphaerae bacterium]|nr:hypothetical protein [Phycisphaerae bacterium]
MAQFKSSAREGSYSNKQLIDPNAVAKIQQQGADKVRAMQNAQSFLEQNQRIASQAQEQAQGIENQNRSTASEIKVKDLKEQKSYTKQAYEYELLKKQNKEKFKVDTLGALVNFSKTAFDVTQKIKKQNLELQQKAINQISFTHKLSHKDVVAAKSVNSSISKAAWQETQVVKDYLDAGKSPDFINAMYDHLVKGGGYTNYIDNASVLREQATINSRVIDQIANDTSLTPTQKRTKIAAADAELRGQLGIDGKVPGTEILDKAYNPTMRRALDRAELLVNKDTNDRLAEKVKRDEFVILNDAAFPDGTLNALAALEVVATSPRANALPNAVNYLVQKGLSVEELEQLLHAPYIKDGKTYTIYNSSPDATAIILQAQKVEKQRESQQIAVEAQEKQLSAEMAVNALAQELATDDGLLSNADYREIENTYFERAGYGADPSILQSIKRQTADVKLIPVMQEQLEEMRLSDTLSVDQLNQINPPKQIYDQYIGAAQALDKIKSTSQYKELNSYLEERIVGSIKEVEEIGFKDMGPQSDQFNWFVGTQINKNKKKILDLVATGTPMEEAMELIGNSAAVEAKKYLLKPDVFDGFMLKPYKAVMDASTKAQLVAQRRVTAFKGLTRAEQTNPSKWITSIGETPLVEASKRLAETGTSEVLNVIGQRTGMTAYEVQRKLSEVSDKIEPIELNKTYEQIQNAWSKEQRYAFTSNQVSNEQRLRTLQQQVNEFENRNSYRTRGTFQSQSSVTGTGVAPEDDTNALIETANELGVNALDLATIIGYETGGSYNPSQWGGEGGRYMGLIQFGESERAKYGVVEGMTFRNQLISVAAFLKDRFKGVGMSTRNASLEDLYTTVLAGNPKANRNSTDSNGTSPISGVQAMGPHREAAAQRYGLELP